MNNFGNDLGLRVRPPENEIAFPDIKKPQPVGFFSVNTDRFFEPNDTQLRYFKPPKNFPLDLNAGLTQAIKKPEHAKYELLEHLLKFIYDQYQRIFANGGPEFVSWRGLLRLIMCSPYEYRQDWCIHVTRFNNTIYMVKKETEQEVYQILQETQQQKTYCAYGYKFEQYCLSSDVFRESDTSGPVNECEEFSLVFQTRLGGMNLIYGAEIDGIVSEQPVQLNYNKPIFDGIKFVELKVRQGNLNKRQHTSYLNHKTRNWWCQTFLVGIDDLYVGLRNDKGYVMNIEHVEMRSLPKQGANQFWAPWVCANFLQQFLSCVKSVTANQNCPHTVCEFYFNAEAGRINYKYLAGKTEHSFIPDWYANLIRRHTQQCQMRK